MTVWRRVLWWDSLTLCVICVADMVSTLYWVHGNKATEGNPWMSLWLEYGDWAFIAAKLLSFIPFLFMTAYFRPRRPKLIALALRGTSLAYVLLYLSSVSGQFLHG